MKRDELKMLVDQLDVDVELLKSRVSKLETKLSFINYVVPTLQMSPTQLNIHNIGNLKIDADLVLKLRKTNLGQIYLKYLKPIPFIRKVVILMWRLSYPKYRNFLTLLPWANSKISWRPLMKMNDFVKANQCSCIEVFASVRVETPPVKVMPSEDQVLLDAPTDHYIFPPIYVAELDMATIYGGSNLVFLRDAVIYHDLYDFQRDYTSEELHGRHLVDVKSMRMRLLLDASEFKNLTCAASFVDSCATNYAHWITEVLPRIAVFCDLPEYADIPIIINAGLHPNIMQSLAIIVGHREVFTLHVGQAIKVHKLIQTSVTGYVPFGVRNKHSSFHRHGAFSPSALNLLKSKMESYLVNNTRGWPEKIYLRRLSNERNIENISEVEKIINEKCYAFIDPESLHFIQQINLLSNSTQVVAATGAALCNAIFSKKNTLITVLMGKHDEMIYRYWANMLQALGLSVSYVLGPQSNAFNEDIHGDFKIDVDALKMII